MWAACLNRRGGCNHTGDVPLTSLIQHLGWDFDYIADRGKMLAILVCSKCGMRNPEVRIGPVIYRPANGHSGSPTAVADAPDGSRGMTYAEHLAWAMKFRAEHPPTPAGGRGRRKWGRRR